MRDFLRTLLSVVCLLALTACGQGWQADEPEEPLTYEMAIVTDTVYQFDSGPINGSYRRPNISGVNGTVYVLSYGNTVSKGSLSRIEPDGSATQVFSAGDVEYFPPILLQTGTDDTLWMRLESEGLESLCQVDLQGSQLDLIDLSGIKKELGVNTVSNFALDGDGWLYLLADGRIHVLNDRLEHQFSLDTGFSSGYTSLLVRFPDSRIGSLVREAAGPGEATACEMRIIDKEDLRWGEAYPVPRFSDHAYSGSGGYLFFVNSAGHICGWSEERGVLEQVVDSSGAHTDLDGEYLKYFAMDPDGTIRIICCPDQDAALEQITLTPVDPDSLPERTVLTLACLGVSSPLQRYVNEFNRSHQNCQIRLVEYADPHAPMDGYERMIVDITAGNVPDLMCLDRLPVEKFGAKDIFEDLWPYIEDDPALGREALMVHALECAEQDGKLYYIFDGFGIRTTACPTAAAGDRLGWTLTDLRAALEQMPPGCQAYNPSESKSRLLYELFSTDAGRFVDWETGVCSFDGREFGEMLDYINSLDISPDQRGNGIGYMEEAILDGRQMLYYPASGGLITNFFSVQLCEAVLGGPVSFVGFPRQDGSCGSALYVSLNNCPLAMTKACGDKEAAWSFLRELLLPQGTRGPWADLFPVWQFPINREDFELLYELSAGVEENPALGERFSDADGNDLLSFQYKAVTQDEYAQIMALYNAVGHIYTTDEDIWEIIGGEAAAYFAGGLGLEDTQKRIQSRAQLYVNEQR